MVEVQSMVTVALDFLGVRANGMIGSGLTLTPRKYNATVTIDCTSTIGIKLFNCAIIKPP